MDIRSAKITGRKFCGTYYWDIDIYLDGKFLVSYTRRTRAAARELVKTYKESGMLPRN